MFPKGQIRFDASTTYKIVVQGILPEIYYPNFRDMKIVVKKDQKGMDSTTCTGTVKDQAALLGILNMLYEFHCSILSVEHIDNKIQKKNDSLTGDD